MPKYSMAAALEGRLPGAGSITGRRASGAASVKPVKLTGLPPLCAGLLAETMHCQHIAMGET